MQTPIRHGPALAVVLLLSAGAAACNDDHEADTIVQTDGGSDGGTNVGGDSAAPHDAASGDARADMDGTVGVDANMLLPDAGAYDANQPLDAASVDDSAAADAALPPDEPELSMASALQVGRFGGDLRVNVTGVRGPADLVAVRIELFNGQRTALGAPRQVPLENPITSAQGSDSVVLAGAFTRYSELTGARITLVDDHGTLSAGIEVTIGVQPKLQSGAACDDTFVANRCDQGLGCKGTPKTCQANEAPALARLGYFVDELGPRILIEGADVDADVVSYRIRFFDGSDQPVAIDHDSLDSTPPVTEDTRAIATQQTTSFFVDLQPSQVLLDAVTTIRVTVLDSTDTASNELSVGKTAAPTRGIGVSCDERGFNRCSDGASCSDFGTAQRCALPVEAQQSACDAALVLDPSHGITRVRGSLHSSLWDPPSGCSMKLLNQSDRVVKLVLPNAASRVTLSTDHPYTSFDTELYVLTACTAAPTLSWCIDDQPAPSTSALAVLALTGVASGEYYVVVDSYPSDTTTGDTFELTVQVE